MRTILILLVLGCLAASMALGATDPAKVLDQNISIKATDQTLPEMLKPVSEKIGMPFVVDEQIKEKVTATLDDMPLSKALNLLCTTRKWTWCLAYLPTAAPTAAQVDSAVSAVGRVKLTGMIVQDPASKQISVVIPSLGPDVSVADLAASLGLKPSIVISAAKVVGDVHTASNPNQVVSRFGPPRNVGGNAVVGQNPGSPNIQSMAQQTVGMFKNLPQDQQMQLMREIRDQMMQNMSPEQRQQMFDRGGQHGRGH